MPLLGPVHVWAPVARKATGSRARAELRVPAEAPGPDHAPWSRRASVVPIGGHVAHRPGPPGPRSRPRIGPRRRPPGARRRHRDRRSGAQRDPLGRAGARHRRPRPRRPYGRCDHSPLGPPALRPRVAPRRREPRRDRSVQRAHRHRTRGRTRGRGAVREPCRRAGRGGHRDLRPRCDRPDPGGGRTACAGPHRRAHRSPEPPRVRGAARPRAGDTDRVARGAHDARHRPLQDRERLTRSPGRRRSDPRGRRAHP